MDCDVTSLKRGRIPIVKVRWNSKRGPEFTWEREEYMESNDQLEWVLWYAPWLSDQLEWVLWYAPWLSDQFEWICGMLHGLVINLSGFVVFSLRLMMLGEVDRETLGLACRVLLICSFDLDLCSAE
ncbi:hypothetical protein Tco_1431969 [Tanacetum coccineum]